MKIAKNNKRNPNIADDFGSTANERRFLFEVSLLYLLADMLEMEMIKVQEMSEYVGVFVAGPLKMSVNGMAHNAKMFRHYLSKESTDTQLALGDCSDCSLQFMRLISDRCHNTEDLFKMYCSIKNKFRIGSGIDLTRDEAKAFA